MAADEIVWQVINQQFCSYKIQINTKAQTFCRNEYNLTGFCNRQSCPLANSRYATVRPDPETGALCLYIRTPERSHLPAKWWEKIRLAQNYEKALAQIDEKLQYWPKFYIHKCKQRLTRLTQVSIRSRRIAKEEERLGEKLVPKLANKVRRREETRERKAESAAKVERAIERELIERLRSGAYGDKPINVEENIWKKVLKGLERAEKGEEVDEDEEEERESEAEEEAEVEYVSDLDESDAGEEGEMEDFDDWLGQEDLDDDDDEDEDEEDSSDEEASDSDDSGSEGSEGGQTKQTASSAKRKRPAAPPRSRKKPARVEIEYETELPAKEALLVR